MKRAVGVVLKLHERQSKHINFHTLLKSVYCFLSFRVTVRTDSGHDVCKRWQKQVLQTDEVILIKKFFKEDDLPRNIPISFYVKFMLKINQTRGSLKRVFLSIIDFESCSFVVMITKFFSLYQSNGV